MSNPVRFNQLSEEKLSQLKLTKDELENMSRTMRTFGRKGTPTFHLERTEGENDEVQKFFEFLKSKGLNSNELKEYLTTKREGSKKHRKKTHRNKKHKKTKRGKKRTRRK